MSASIYKIISDMSAMIKPPNRLGVVSTVCKTLVVSTGGSNGYYDIKTTPYMAEPMECVADRSLNTVCFVGSARSGKSLSLGEGVMSYKVSSAPADMLNIYPTAEFTRRFSRLRVGRAIANSPVLRDLLSNFSHEDNIGMKVFRNGMAIVLSHPSPSALSGNDYQIVTICDHDRMQSDSNGEASVYAQALKRTQTFGTSGCCIVESSPGRDFTDIEWKRSTAHEAPPVEGALGIYNQGDRRIYQWECPHCHDPMHMYPSLELFNLPDEKTVMDTIRKVGALGAAKKHAYIWCKSCGGRIGFGNRHRMNLGGYWKKENEEKPNKIGSFWQSGLMASFQTWEELLEKEFAAVLHYADTGDASKIKTTRNVDLGIPYVPMGVLNKFTARELSSRAEDFPARTVMEGVRFLLATVDVQGNMFVCQVQGNGVDDEKWIIDRFNITKSLRTDDTDIYPVSPSTHLEDWNLLVSEVLDKRYPLNDESGRTMGIRALFCDSGGREGVTENAYKAWRSITINQKRPNFYLVKGLPSQGDLPKPFVQKTILDKTSNSAMKAGVIGKLHLWTLNSNLLKDAVDANLKKTEVGSGYYHFGSWLPLWWYDQIIAEVRTDKGWKNPKSRRNETFDLLYYAKAGLMILLYNFRNKSIDWEHPPLWAEEWDKNEYVDNDQPEILVEPKNKNKGMRKTRMKARR